MASTRNSFFSDLGYFDISEIGALLNQALLNQALLRQALLKQALLKQTVGGASPRIVVLPQPDAAYPNQTRCIPTTFKDACYPNQSNPFK